MNSLASITLRDLRHSPFLSAYIGGHLYGFPVGFLDAVPIEKASYEGPREGIPGSDGALDLYSRGPLEALSVFPEYPAAVDTLREDNHLEVIKTHQTAAEGLFSGHLVTKEPRYHTQLPLVELEDIRPVKAFLYCGLREEPLPEVDVADLQTVLGAVVQEDPDGVPGFPPPLGQGAEADGFRAGGDPADIIRHRDMVPGDIRPDGVHGGVRVGDIRINGPCGVGDPFQMAAEVVLGQFRHDIVPLSVVADGAHHQAVMAELGNVIGEVCRCAAELPAPADGLPIL